MKRFGFCDILIQCIRAIYSSPTSRINVNGGLSSRITLQRGCRQGYSSNLFIESLTKVIREETDLEGITIGSAENKICLYENDVLLIKNPESDVQLLMEILLECGRLVIHLTYKNSSLVFIFFTM